MRPWIGAQSAFGSVVKIEPRRGAERVFRLPPLQQAGEHYGPSGLRGDEIGLLSRRHDRSPFADAICRRIRAANPGPPHPGPFPDPTGVAAIFFAFEKANSRNAGKAR